MQNRSAQTKEQRCCVTSEKDQANCQPMQNRHGIRAQPETVDIMHQWFLIHLLHTDRIVSETRNTIFHHLSMHFSACHMMTLKCTSCAASPFPSSDTHGSQPSNTSSAPDTRLQRSNTANDEHPYQDCCSDAIILEVNPSCASE